MQCGSTAADTNSKARPGLFPGCSAALTICTLTGTIGVEKSCGWEQKLKVDFTRRFFLRGRWVVVNYLVSLICVERSYLNAATCSEWDIEQLPTILECSASNDGFANSCSVDT